MQKFILFLFAIPILSFVVIAIYQVCDEMFKKHFHLERRAAPSADAPKDAPRRRYSDSVPPGTPRPPRNPEAATSATSAEVSVPQANGV